MLGEAVATAGDLQGPHTEVAADLPGGAELAAGHDLADEGKGEEEPREKQETLIGVEEKLLENQEDGKEVVSQKACLRTTRM